MEMIGVRGRTRALRLGRLREGRGAPHAGRGELVVGDDCCGDIILNWRSVRMMVVAPGFRPKRAERRLHRSSMIRQKLQTSNLALCSRSMQQPKEEL